jgi:hypothetical protein
MFSGAAANKRVKGPQLPSQKEIDKKLTEAEE